MTEPINWQHECGLNAKARARAEAEAFEAREKIRKADERCVQSDKDLRESDETVKALVKLTGQQAVQILELKAELERMTKIATGEDL